MWLLIDAGNTRIKFRIYKGLHTEAEGAFSSAKYIVEMDPWITGISGIDRIVISSVIGQDFDLWMKGKCAELGLPEPEFVFTPKQGLGIQVGYDDPGQFGVDRYLAMAAGIKQARGAAIIVDSGTAVTIDAVSANGQHHGGVIMPGVTMMKKALLQHARSVEAMESEGIQVFSHSTSAGVSSGALFAVVGGVREVLERQTALMDEIPQYLITGGAGEQIAEYLGLPCRVCHNLVFDGLMMFANQ